jgi:general secretion pathway protein M
MIVPTARLPRCLLALSALALVLLLVVLGLLLPWLEQNDEYDRQILLRNRQLAGYERQIATLPSLRDELAALDSNQSSSAYYIEASDASLGGVTLQRLIEQMVGDAGGTMTSIQILPAVPDGRLTRIGVRLRLQVDPGGLRRILYGVESNEPLLFVEKLNLRSLQRRSRRQNGSQEEVMELNANLDVYGYIREAKG